MEENEILTFILGVVALVIVIPVARKMTFTGKRPFLLAVVFIVCSYFFTNLEAVCFPSVCNIIEHLFFAAAGLSILIAVYYFHKGDNPQ